MKMRRFIFKPWFFVFVLPFLLSLRNPRGESEPENTITETASTSSSHGSFRSNCAASSFLFDFNQRSRDGSNLQYNFYRDSCPHAEEIIRSAVIRMQLDYKELAKSILDLFFRDCFIQGCHTSSLLEDNGTIDIIKEAVEKACPGIVSCADTIALASRDSIFLAGGQFYPVLTGRHDSLPSSSFYQNSLAIRPCDATPSPSPSPHIFPTSRSKLIRIWLERIGYGLLCVFLLSVSGLMAGATMAFMTVKRIDLYIKQFGGTPAEKQFSGAIISLLEQETEVLVTLLVWNSAALELLPIFLDKLFGDYISIILSVTLVLIVGEIIPQAACHTNALKVAFRLIGFVQHLVCLTTPITLPIVFVLEKLAPPEHNFLYSRSELISLVNLHSIQADFGGDLTLEQVQEMTDTLLQVQEMTDILPQV